MSVAALQTTPGMTLADLLDDRVAAASVLPETIASLPVTGLAADSRDVGDGDVFLAVAGRRSHGMDYAADVIARGAAAIVYDRTTVTGSHSVEGPVPVIGVDRLAARIGTIADRFYGQPSAALDVIGVTGTNGKTTVSWLLADCLARAGGQCAYLGTLGAGVIGDTGDGPRAALNTTADDRPGTTPDTVAMHGRLADFVAAGANAAAVEVSSHALDQHRVDAVRFRAAVLTNLSRDHLDYHGDMQSYADAKARLFDEHAPALRVVCTDSEFGAALAARSDSDVIAVSSTGEPAEFEHFVHADTTAVLPGGSRLRLRTSVGEAEFDLPMPGDFNRQNAAVVAATLLGLGHTLTDVCAWLAAVSPPAGRMQIVGAAPTVVIDYAHSPAALAAALAALRPHTSGRLSVVFGCGGERDSGKRPQMGAIAEQGADTVIVTSDNPRGEPAAEIIADVVAGAIAPDALTVIEDRAAAIAYAIGNAAPADTVLIAGKGHEDYQVLGTQRIAFSDAAVAAAALAARARRSR